MNFNTFQFEVKILAAFDLVFKELPAMKLDVQQHQHSHTIDQDVDEAERWDDLLQDEDRRPAASALTSYRS